MRATQLKDNIPYYFNTHRIWRWECCKCGNKHYESYEVISEDVIKIVVNCKEGISYVKDNTAKIEEQNSGRASDSSNLRAGEEEEYSSELYDASNLCYETLRG